MVLEIPQEVFDQINAHGEEAYPEEGAGLLLGQVNGDQKRVAAILKLDNSREDSARHNRYLLTPENYLRGEQEANRLNMDVIGVFHSHPDHPNRPSEFDREWAMPWFSYLITSVQKGKRDGSRSWQLSEDRENFIEERIQII